MDILEIEEFVNVTNRAKIPVKVRFKSRRSMIGIFVQLSDFDDLKSKNLWRIVGERLIDLYNQSNNKTLAKIFNGSEFTSIKLT